MPRIRSRTSRTNSKPSKALVPVKPLPAPVLASLEPVAARAREFIAGAQSESTRRVYRTAWRGFERWCAEHDVASMPAHPAAIAMYVTKLADDGRKVATISQALAAIAHQHHQYGHESPTEHHDVRKCVRGIRRKLGTAQKQVAPAVTDVIRKMLGALGSERTVDVRDRALVLLGFAAALRSAECVALDVAGVEFVPEGLRITIRSSKTDAEGHGEVLGVAVGQNPETCPVRAVRAWLELLEIAGAAKGPLFRYVNKGGTVGADALTTRGYAKIVKRAIARAGLDATKYASHSLRAGFVTTAAVNEVEERHIMRQTRHRSVVMVRKYIRDANLFRKNASGDLGL